MKNNFAKRLLSLTLAIVLCMGSSILAMAAVYEGYPGLTFSATLDKSTINVNNDEAQTVVLTIAPSQTVQTGSITYSISVPSGLELISITSNKFTDIANYASVENKTVNWFTMGEDYTDVNEIGILTFNVPAGTRAGEYEITINGIELTNNSNTYPTVDGVSVKGSATTTLTITSEGSDDEKPTEDYTATITNASGTQDLRVGDEVTINIGVNKNHSAAKLTVSFNSGLVEFVRASVNDTSGATNTVTLATYGDEKAAASDNYVLTFRAIADGNAAFTITEAQFGTGESAETASLEDASKPGVLNVTIAPELHSVTFEQYEGKDIFTGNETVENGATYNFKPETTTGLYYDYTSPVVKMGDVTTSVTGNAESGWSVANVTDDLVISGTRTGKEYGVTIDTEFGGKTTSESYTANYGIDYEFVVPNDVAPGENVGYSYELKSVTIGGAAYTGYSCASGTRDYTIPGSAITGDIVITITKTEQEANTFNVSITGEGAGQVSANPTQVVAGGSVTLTLTPETGYSYVIKVNGATVTLIDNKYTISNVQSANDVKVVVEKNVDITNAESTQYIQLDGSSMWLVKIAPTNPGTKIAGKTYTYNGKNMFWSEKYEAYCYLEIAGTKPTLESGDFTLTDVGSIPEIIYDMNVNMSSDGLVDPADAQLVWNMYSTKYDSFTQNVTLEKFLKADVNGDKIVNTTDAGAIINSVLGK